MPRMLLQRFELISKDSTFVDVFPSDLIPLIDGYSRMVFVMTSNNQQDYRQSFVRVSMSF